MILKTRKFPEEPIRAGLLCSREGEERVQARDEGEKKSKCPGKPVF